MISFIFSVSLSLSHPKSIKYYSYIFAKYFYFAGIPFNDLSRNSTYGSL